MDLKKLAPWNWLKKEDEHGAEYQIKIQKKRPKIKFFDFVKIKKSMSHDTAM